MHRIDVEKQLRGLDITMAEVGYRFTELYFAGKDRNWDYAKYQAEKIELAIRLAGTSSQTRPVGPVFLE